MTKEDVAYDLLVDVFDVFFNHMRAGEGAEYEEALEYEAQWDKDWDELSRPILNRIEESLENAELVWEAELTGEANGPRRSRPSNPRPGSGPAMSVLTAFFEGRTK